MAIEVADVAVSLRLIGDNTLEVPPGIASILTRLVGVAEAHAGLIVPNAPEAVQDEIIIRMASYLYDQPTAARGLNYANAWGHSGAAALAHRWIVQRVAGETGGAVRTGIPLVGGLDAEQVAALIAAHQAIVAAHHAPGESGGPGLSEDDVLALVSTWARATAPTGLIPPLLLAESPADDSVLLVTSQGRAFRYVEASTLPGAQQLVGHAADADAHHSKPGLAFTVSTPDANGLVTVSYVYDGGSSVDLGTFATTASMGDGGGTPATPTPPTTLVDGALYTAHGAVTIPGWRGYDFIQFFYTVGTDTYSTAAVNTVQILALTPVLVSVGRNVTWSLTPDLTDDDVITTAASAGNAVPVPTATSTLTVIAWNAGTVVEGGGGGDGTDAIARACSSSRADRCGRCPDRRHAAQTTQPAQVDITDHEDNHPGGVGSGDDAYDWATVGNDDLLVPSR